MPQGNSPAFSHPLFKLPNPSGVHVAARKHGFGMGFGDPEEGAGGAFSGLFPVLQGSWAEAHEGGELGFG